MKRLIFDGMIKTRYLEFNFITPVAAFMFSNLLTHYPSTEAIHYQRTRSRTLKTQCLLFVNTYTCTMYIKFIPECTQNIRWDRYLTLPQGTKDSIFLCTNSIKVMVSSEKYRVPSFYVLHHLDAAGSISFLSSSQLPLCPAILCSKYMCMNFNQHFSILMVKN